MVPGIISLADIVDEKVEIPNFLTIPESFKPTTTVPWLVSIPVPFIAGMIGVAIAGPVTRKTTDSEIRVRNGIGALATGLTTFFSWRATLDKEVYMGLRIGAGVTGVFWGLASIAMLWSTFAPGPFVRTKSEFASFLRKKKSIA
jgi:hypothetical protein